MRILWVSHTGWRVPQRAHLFCRALSERHEIHVAESATEFVNLPDYVSVRYLRSLTPSSYRDGSITVHRIPRFSPALFIRPLRQLNNKLFRRYVERIVARHRIDRVVGTFPLSPIDAPRLIFDSFDANAAYWRAPGGSRGYANEIALTEYRYLQEADAVVAASSVLADQARALVPRGPVYHIPNGVDLRRFERVGTLEARGALGISGTVVGSVANYDRPVELNLILDAARLLASQGIVFVIAGRGRALPGAIARARRERIRNVVFREYVPPDDAPALISAFDVGLCAYPSSPMDDARMPMRLLSYAAAGLPVVCTDLEEVRRMGFANVIRVDDAPSALAQGVLDAMALPRVRPPQVAQFDLRALTARYEAVLAGGVPEAPDPMVSSAPTQEPRSTA